MCYICIIIIGEAGHLLVRTDARWKEIFIVIIKWNYFLSHSARSNERKNNNEIKNVWSRPKQLYFLTCSHLQYIFSSFFLSIIYEKPLSISNGPFFDVFDSATDIIVFAEKEICSRNGTAFMCVVCYCGSVVDLGRRRRSCHVTPPSRNFFDFSQWKPTKNEFALPQMSPRIDFCLWTSSPREIVVPPFQNPRSATVVVSSILKFR